jgi:hypothetical protein
MELVKVQTPQATKPPQALALVYDKDRKYLMQQHLHAATRDAMGSDAKAFFEAEYRPRLVDGNR